MMILLFGKPYDIGVGCNRQRPLYKNKAESCFFTQPVYLYRNVLIYRRKKTTLVCKLGELH